MITLQTSLEVKPYSLTEIANIYGVSNHVMKTWLKQFQLQLGEKKGRYYTVAQVKLIFSKLDLPGKYMEAA